jgi:hypothetical protein
MKLVVVHFHGKAFILNGKLACTRLESYKPSAGEGLRQNEEMVRTVCESESTHPGGLPATRQQREVET